MLGSKSPKPHDVQLKSVVIPKRPQKPETPLDISKILSSSASRRPATSPQEREMATALDLELEHEFTSDTQNSVDSSPPSRKRKAFVYYETDTDSEDLSDDADESPSLAAPFSFSPNQKNSTRMIGSTFSAMNDDEEEFSLIGQNSESDDFSDSEIIQPCLLSQVPSATPIQRNLPPDESNLDDNLDNFSEFDGDEAEAELDDEDEEFKIEDCEAAVRGSEFFQDTVVELKSDGRLMLDGVCRLTFNREEIAKARDAGVFNCRLSLDSHGYIWGSGGFGKLHRYFTTCYLDSDFQEFTALGCPFPKANYVVGHWNNILNFLDERNKNIPALLNSWSQLGKVYENPTGLYYCVVKVKGNRLLRTANVDSPAKAIHSRDVLQIRLLPAWARPYWLSLRRSQCPSPEFLTTYDSIESLLACATLYPKTHKSRKSNVGDRFSLIELSEASEIIRQGARLARRDGRSLNSDDCLVRYTGSRGKVVDFVVSKEDFMTFIKPFKGNFHVKKGQIFLGNDTLARLVLGLRVGDYDRDAKEVLHSPSGKRWNRPQDLRLGTRPDNARDIIRRNSHGTGITKNKKKYLAEIRIMCPGLKSTTLVSKEAALAVRAAIVSHVPHFIREFKAEGCFNTGMKNQTVFQPVRRRIFHAFVSKFMRSEEFLSKFTAKGGIRTSVCA